MRPFLLVLPVALCAAVAHAQPETPQAPVPVTVFGQPVRGAVQLPVVKPRPGTPQEQIKVDLTKFVTNLNTNQAFMGSNGLIYGANTAYWGANEWAKNWEALGVQVKLDEITVEKVEDKQATATIRYHAQAGPELLNEVLKARANRGNVQGMTETLTLRKQQVGDHEYWQIVPPEKLDPNAPETGILAYVIYVLAQKGDVPLDALPYSLNTEGDRSIQNLKQLGLAVMMFVQDYDELYLFRPQYAQEALLPYIKSAQIFRVPASQRTYTFNANLSGKSLAAVDEPTRTVLFYEGDNQQPIFHYNGKAAICFADAHCVLVSPEEFKNVIWEIKPQKP